MKWTSRAVVAAAFLGAVAGCGGTGPPAPGASPSRGERPNVVLILVDDLGYADLGVQGAPELRTPSLDALARAGLQCTDGYASAPQCFPSRAGLMTGRYSQRFGIEHNRSAEPTNLPRDATTLAERMKAAGYATGLVGKWNLGEGDGHDPLARGFDEFFGFLTFAHRYVRNDRFKDDEQDKLRRGREPVLESEYLTDAFARESRDFILRHRQEPFFLFVSLNAPHTPLQADPRWDGAFAGLREPRDRYAAMVGSLDRAVGVIRATLDEVGVARNTLVLFLSDNGADAVHGGCNDPLRGGKHVLWEGGIRVPWLVAFPGRVPAGRLDARPVLAVDIAATVLDACATPAAPGVLDGPSRWARWTGAADDAGDDPLFWRFFGGPRMAATHAWAIRQGPWKAVLPSWRYGVQGDDGGVRLYRLPEDPSEERDLAADHPDVLADLRARWDAWNDTLPGPGDGVGGEEPGGDDSD